MLSMECTYLKRYSRAARWTIAFGGALFIVLIMWASVAIAYRTDNASPLVKALLNTIAPG